MKKKPSKKKDVTMNDLAVMVQRGFDEVYERMEDRFARLDKKIDDLELKIEDINRRLDIIEHKLIERHDREIELLRDRILKIETRLARQR